MNLKLALGHNVYHHVRISIRLHPRKISPSRTHLSSSFGSCHCRFNSCGLVADIILGGGIEPILSRFYLYIDGRIYCAVQSFFFNTASTGLLRAANSHHGARSHRNPVVSRLRHRAPGEPVQESPNGSHGLSIAGRVDSTAYRFLQCSLRRQQDSGGRIEGYRHQDLP